MLKIRLQRVGKKHDPSFRVILIDSRKGPKSGSFIENLGFYDAIRKVRKIKADRVKHWIANGAQVSDTVHNILISEKIIEVLTNHDLAEEMSRKGIAQAAKFTWAETTKETLAIYNEMQA